MMRQAGRYMPEYRAIREKHSMLTVCKTPELALEVTLQPLKFGMDAAILFADILLPLEPMGAPFDFAKGEGPVIFSPIATKADVDKLHGFEIEEGLGYVLKAIKLLKKELKVPLIGFAGAPFTLASYLIEGGKSSAFAKAKRFMYAEPETFSVLMQKLAEVVRQFLHAQIDAGVDAVQLFDSWVGQLSAADYRTYVLPHVAHILKDIEKRGVPVIHFGTGTYHLLEAQREAGGTVMGLDWRTPLGEGWARVGADRAVQGNLDPTVLLGPRELAEKHAARVIEQAAGKAGHIFNLGHGILPETPVENVQAVIEFVHRTSARS
jgi:uroporphyrinogen decarboxylase